MSDKAKGIYFIVFAALYFGYTIFFVGHGIHWTNSLITLSSIALSGYYFMKDYRK